MRRARAAARRRAPRPSRGTPSRTRSARDAALLVERDVLVAMARHRREPHALEERAERLRVGRGVLDELEAVGADRVEPGRLLVLGHEPILDPRSYAQRFGYHPFMPRVPPADFEPALRKRLEEL